MRLFAEALANLLPVCPCLSHLSLYHPPPLLLLTASGNGALSPIASSIHCALTDQPKKEKGTAPENTFANTARIRIPASRSSSLILRQKCRGGVVGRWRGKSRRRKKGAFKKLCSPLEGIQPYILRRRLRPREGGAGRKILG